MIIDVTSISLLIGLVSPHFRTTNAFIPMQGKQGMATYTWYRGLSPVHVKKISTIRAASAKAEADQDILDDSTSSRTVISSDDNKNNPPFENFDYEDHWYPCIWECDLELDEPTKVTIFDVDYVVAKTSKGEVIAMKDYCTHKGAALSEGRVTATGNFQCAYHGWSFNGTTGECVDIPQIVRNTVSSDSDDGTHTTTTKSAPIPSRACTTAVPAQVHLGMVWLFPYGGLEKALTAPPPPTMDLPHEFQKMSHAPVVRDMPVDWPILLSNICDPDHGLFAHQDKAFDMYTASYDSPFESFISEETYGGRGWSLKTAVDAGDKITLVDRTRRQRLGKKKKEVKDSTKSKTKTKAAPLATTHFRAPTSIQMNRVNRETGEIKFMSLFFICPVGVGRSRFMATGLSTSGIKPPRWLSHLIVANFVDQDTFLLATQQHNLLPMEADDLRVGMEERGISRNRTDLKDKMKLKTLRMRTRRDNFCLASPTDRIGSKLEQFWDATLARCPNRIENLLRLDESGTFLQQPSREDVLDRESQNLLLSKDSRGVVRNCRRTRFIARLTFAMLLLVKLLLGPSASMSGLPVLQALAKPFVKTRASVKILTLLWVISTLADKLEKEFYYKYTDDMRRRDMKEIPKKIWVD